MTLDPSKRAQILRSIKKLILAHHINVGGIDYSAWTERVDGRTAELLNAEVDAFEAGIRQLLAELTTSHTVFVTVQVPPSILLDKSRRIV